MLSILLAVFLVTASKAEAMCDPPCDSVHQCVTTDDKSWSQCIPSNKDKFEADCVKWDDNLRLAAIKATGITCQNSRCYSEEWCTDGFICAAQDEGWAQCVDCTPSRFQTNSYSWTAKFKAAAEAACKKAQYDAEPPDAMEANTEPAMDDSCYSQSGDLPQHCASRSQAAAMCDPPCDSVHQCVTTDDNSWSQCIPSNKDKFEADCVKWDDNLRLAAIKATGITCQNSRCYSGEWCTDGFMCAVQDAGWAQCVDCTPSRFQTNSYSWTAKFKAAAEIACGFGFVDSEGQGQAKSNDLRPLKWRWAQHVVNGPFGMSTSVPRAPFEDKWNEPESRRAFKEEIEEKLSSFEADAKQFATRAVELADASLPERRITFENYVRALEWLKREENIE